MDEMVKSIKAFLYDRTVSPLFGAFITSWLAWNYKVIIALLDGDEPFLNKISFIDNHFGLVSYQINNQLYFLPGQIIHGLLAPALLTLFYLYVYPKLATPVYEHSLAKQTELRLIKQKEANDRLLTVDESRKYIKEIEQLRLKYDEDTKAYSERITRLTETINTLEANLKPAKLSSLASPLNNEKYNEPSLDDFRVLISEKVNALPVGEFQLSDLFERNSWEAINQTVRKIYGKLFKELVDRGEFDNIALSKKGSANQNIYIKTSLGSSNVPDDFRSQLLNQYKFFDNLPEPERTELLNKIITESVLNDVTIDMFEILMPLVFSDGRINNRDLEKISTAKLGKIELDHAIEKLSSRNFVYHIDNDIALTSEGKKFVIDSGMTKLGKEKYKF